MRDARLVRDARLGGALEPRDGGGAARGRVREHDGHRERAPAPESARVGVFSAAETPACEIPEVGWFPGAARGGAPAGEMFSLMAVPKRKVSPSRRKRRNQFKRIEFISDVHRCKDCGKAKRPHVYCEQCSTNIYDDLKMGGDVGGGASR